MRTVIRTFNAMVKSHSENEKRVKALADLLRNHLGDGCDLFYQPADGWTVVWQSKRWKKEIDLNATVSPKEFSALLEMSKADALVWLEAHSI